ncbi:MAG TPA: hypothetical protein VFS12_12700 [Terriglobia bacterium]|nr:hypothetical protein [Terriglobia bacterium]
MPRYGATFDENFSSSSSFSSSYSAFVEDEHDNPLKAQRLLSFRLPSPFGKGDF